MTKSVNVRPQSADGSTKVSSICQKQLFYLLISLSIVKRDPLVDTQKLNTFRDLSSARATSASVNYSNKLMYERMHSITLNNTKRVPLKSYKNENNMQSMGKSRSFIEDGENL